jgi:hypothetical protein
MGFSPQFPLARRFNPGTRSWKIRGVIKAWSLMVLKKKKKLQPLELLIKVVFQNGAVLQAHMKGMVHLLGHYYNCISELMIKSMHRIWSREKMGWYM